jgi:hypothetical protein
MKACSFRKVKNKLNEMKSVSANKPKRWASNSSLSLTCRASHTFHIPGCGRSEHLEKHPTPPPISSHTLENNNVTPKKP